MTELHMEAGHLGIDQNTSSRGFYFLWSIPQNLGWLLTIGALCSAVYVLGLKDKRLFVLIVIPVVLVLVLGYWKMRADRYILPVIPFMLILCSIGLVRLWDRVLPSFN